MAPKDVAGVRRLAGKLAGKWIVKESSGRGGRRGRRRGGAGGGNSAAREAADLLTELCKKEGALGTITHAHYRNAHHAAYGRWFDSDDVNWFTKSDLAGGGAFMDMGTHAVHRLGSVLGKVDSVMATIGNAAAIYPDVDDHGIAWLRYANGVLGTVEASWVQTGGHGGGFEITGSEGTLFEHPNKGYLVATPGEDPVSIAVGTARPTQVDRLVATINGEMTRQKLDADLQCAVDAVAVMEACYESNRSGHWVDVRSAG